MNMRKRGELLLKLLPVKSQAVDTATIYERLLGQGIKVSFRTLQRDLKRLAADYPHIRSEDRGSSHHWWAERELSRLSLLPSDALNLTMIMDHAIRFGMQAQVEKLATLRNYARALLKDARPSEDWSKKVMSTTRSIVLRPSTIDPDVLATLQHALLYDYAVEATYCKRIGDTPVVQRLKPLGLSFQDSTIYLSCIFAGQEMGRVPNALPLHRFVSARTVADDIPTPEGYDIHSVEACRSLLGLQSKAPVALKLRLGKELYERLAENPLTEDQHLSIESTETWIMSGTLFLSQGLTLWLLGQGDKLEVLEPLPLRGEIAAATARMAALYHNEGSDNRDHR
ncbi:WYL domain-containing protein [Pseudomonas delhiensis]|uniref:helix-turn-helix transcriptional regulator n=1 Tax=Pseudomonas delhiensis TaxID=366289 RepID=UPI00315A4688